MNILRRLLDFIYFRHLVPWLPSVLVAILL